MSKKPRENRIPIMMSDDELQSVDDWRFRNRIGTRSDAVRRLVQIGLRATERMPELSKLTGEALDKVMDAGWSIPNPDETTPQDLRSSLLKYMEIAVWNAASLHELGVNFAQELDALRGEGELPEVAATADEARKAGEAAIERWRAGLEEGK